ncbi:SecDF P1 head subdomain-containing protein [Marivita sp. S0852]|uniref:SecDF P1 head subdomain-containing protein n=1 Tax=Marivita sp. S0852 TaxID=3373893 RepID=UPI0039821F53
MDILWPTIRSALVKERSSVGFISREPRLNGELHVLISEVSGAEQALEAVSNALSDVPNFSEVPEAIVQAKVSGNRVVVAFDEESSEAISSHLVNTASLELASRLAAFGLQDGRIDVLDVGDGVIRFLGFNTAPANELIGLFETQGKISLRSVIGRTENRGTDAGRGNDLLPARSEQNSYFIVEQSNIIENVDFIGFESTFDLNGHPAISFRLSADGAQKLTSHTQNNLGGIAAVVLDEEVVATIRNEVRIPADEGLIAGRFNKSDADRLAAILNTGSFAVELEVVQFREISPPLNLPN